MQFRAYLGMSAWLVLESTGTGFPGSTRLVSGCITIVRGIYCSSGVRGT